MPYNDPSPIKDVARITLNRAIRSGKITRPDHCEGCNKQCKPDGHHNDYDEPLEVNWLCKTCHGEVHSFYGGFYKFEDMFNVIL